MKKFARKLFGFRSGTPWKKGLAVVYYLACIAFLILAMTTPPLIAAGAKDVSIMRMSSLVLVLMAASPAIFLSDTPMRDFLPFFKDRTLLRSLVGMMIVWLLLLYLFMCSEALHTPEYKAAFTVYIQASFNTFVEAGSSGLQ